MAPTSTLPGTAGALAVGSRVQGVGCEAGSLVRRPDRLTGQQAATQRWQPAAALAGLQGSRLPAPSAIPLPCRSAKVPGQPQRLHPQSGDNRQAPASAKPSAPTPPSHPHSHPGAVQSALSRSHAEPGCLAVGRGLPTRHRRLCQAAGRPGAAPGRLASAGMGCGCRPSPRPSAPRAAAAPPTPPSRPAAQRSAWPSPRRARTRASPSRARAGPVRAARRHRAAAAPGPAPMQSCSSNRRQRARAAAANAPLACALHACRPAEQPDLHLHRPGPGCGARGDWRQGRLLPGHVLGHHGRRQEGGCWAAVAPCSSMHGDARSRRCYCPTCP